MIDGLVRGILDTINVVPEMALNLPGLRGLVGRYLTVVTYTGRRSGQIFSTPVAYRRDGQQVRIGVEFPDAKQWWRNFLGAGRPLQLRLNGVDVPGYGVARRDEQGRVTVTVRLDDNG